MAFDLSQVLQNVSRPDTAEAIQYVPYANLIPAENNGYSMDGLDELARNIELVGLQQPLRVRPLSDDTFGIISGHRRHAAIGVLIGRNGKSFAAGVPCIVDRSDASPALRELQLLLGNADNRKLTAADEAQQIERISDCLRRLEDEGWHLKGRHRDWISKLSGMSKTKIARLQAIQKNLIQPLIQPFNEGKLPETAAYALQQLPDDFQLEAFARMNKKTGFEAAPADRIQTCVDRAAKYAEDLDCPAGLSCTQHARRISATLSAQYAFARCEGGCCLSCSELERCAFPCAAGKAKIREKKQKLQKEEEKDKARREAEDRKTQEKYRKAKQRTAARLVPVIDAVGLPDDHRLSVNYYGSVTVAEIRKYAVGDFGTERLYAGELVPSTIYGLREAAKDLRCSTDFLLGLSDSPNRGGTPDRETGWITEGEIPDGRYLCLVDMNTGKLHEQRCERRDGVWLCYGSPIHELFSVKAWWPLPPEQRRLPGAEPEMDEEDEDDAEL